MALAVRDAPTRLRARQVEGPAQVEVQEGKRAVRPREDPTSPREEGNIPCISTDDDPTFLHRDLLIIVNPTVATHTEVNHHHH